MTVTLPASLPQPAFDAKQVQQNEAKVAQHQGINMVDLMEKAGAAVFSQLQKMLPEKASLLVVCGKGNNGGDGYIAARLAAAAGYQVEVIVLAEHAAIKGDAKTALNLAQKAHITVHFTADIVSAIALITHSPANLIVDGIFGIGFSGALTKPMQQVIAEINQHSAKIIAIDVPSGLSAETGAVESIAILAEATVSFIALKKGLFTGKAADHLGRFIFADLGLSDAFSKEVPTATYVQTLENLPLLLPRKASAHKGDVGLLLAIGSNLGMPGAIRMSAEAALRTGASLVAVSTHQENHAMLVAGRPELMLAPSQAAQLTNYPSLQKVKAVIIGPGLGQDEWAQQFFSLVCQLNKPRVIDADALVLLSKYPQKQLNWVLTPHPGEAAALLGCDIATIENDRFYAVKTIAKTYGGVCILKGAGSLISDGETVWINTSGNCGMATGGMGDVLSGIIAALMMQMPNIFDAARLAVFIHGQAGDIIAEQKGQRGMLASDLFSAIQPLVNRDINE